MLPPLKKRKGIRDSIKTADFWQTRAVSWKGRRKVVSAVEIKQTDMTWKGRNDRWIQPTKKQRVRSYPVYELAIIMIIIIMKLNNVSE